MIQLPELDGTKQVRHFVLSFIFRLQYAATVLAGSNIRLLYNAGDTSELNFTRRNFFRLALSALALSGSSVVKLVTAQESILQGTAEELEQSLGARLGISVFDEETGRSWSYNADQRFPMCSTFKLLAVGAFLARVDRGEDSLQRRVIIERDDLVSYSPATETRVGGEGMTMAEICEAALTLSDNTAGNKILESIEGPQGLTRFVRSLGDEVTRLDRWETELNEALVGDPRDTTSPNAMVNTLRKLLLGNVLSKEGRQQLSTWMQANQTGDAKLRAGLPSAWVVGDKTGGGDNGTMADVGVLWPENRKPIFVAVYMTETQASFDNRNEGIAEIARALSQTI